MINGTVTVNFDDKAQTEYDEDFKDISSIDELVADILTKHLAEKKIVSSMVITVTFL